MATALQREFRLDAIIQDITRGMSPGALSRKYQISPETVRNILTPKLGMSPRDFHTKVRKEKVRTLFRLGYPHRAIARSLQVCQSTVFNDIHSDDGTDQLDKSVGVTIQIIRPITDVNGEVIQCGDYLCFPLGDKMVLYREKHSHTAVIGDISANSKLIPQFSTQVVEG